MKYNPEKHKRRSTRLQDYDYTQAGAYFVTICTLQRQPIFGDIDEDGEMLLNTVGCIAQEEWERTAQVRANVLLDEFVVMPNHIHGIIILNGDSVGVCRRQTPTHAHFAQPISGALGTIIGQFKSLVTKRSNRLRLANGGSVWQTNFHDHIIRNDAELNRIRGYILNNPLRWADDRYHPMKDNKG